MSFREIIETEDFLDEKATIEPNAKRIDAMLFAVTWALAKHPEHFNKVPGTKRLYMVATDPFPGAPPLRIWYTFNDKEVELLSIEATDEKD